MPSHSPDAIFGRYSAFCASLPCARIAVYAPCASDGYIVHAWFTAYFISEKAISIRCGSPWPPNSGSADTAGQPPSQYCRYAALKPFGTVTSCVAGSKWQPSWSPDRFSGSSTSAQNFPPSASTWSIVSASRSACSGISRSDVVTSSSSCMTNCMSRSGGW